MLRACAGVWRPSGAEARNDADRVKYRPHSVRIHLCSVASHRSRHSSDAMLVGQMHCDDESWWLLMLGLATEADTQMELDDGEDGGSEDEDEGSRSR